MRTNIVVGLVNDDDDDNNNNGIMYSSMFRQRFLHKSSVRLLVDVHKTVSRGPSRSKSN